MTISLPPKGLKTSISFGVTTHLGYSFQLVGLFAGQLALLLLVLFELRPGEHRLNNSRLGQLRLEFVGDGALRPELTHLQRHVLFRLRVKCRVDDQAIDKYPHVIAYHMRLNHDTTFVFLLDGLGQYSLQNLGHVFDVPATYIHTYVCIQVHTHARE